MDQKFPPEKAALLRAARLLGGQTELAKVLGYKDRRNVWPWCNYGGPQLPAEHCPVIERATGGAVRCEELRPDVAWSVLREAV